MRHSYNIMTSCHICQQKRFRKQEIVFGERSFLQVQQKQRSNQWDKFIFFH